MKRIELNEQHLLLLNMAKEFHKICERHGIPYYMLGGTMLGAIRHKGFIPWDDDMDFGIPRNRYDEFCMYAEKELLEPYRLLTVNNSDYAVLGINKLNNDNTVFPEIWSVDTEETLGVNIDIFPLDYTDRKIGFLSSNWIVRKGFKLQKLLFMKSEFRPWHKKLLAIIAKSLIRVKKNTIPDFLHNYMLNRQCDVEMVANLYGAWAMKEVVPKNIFGNPCLYQFEDTMLYGVENADGYLKQLYNNYIQLPPEDKRHVHANEIYYK